MNSGYTFDGLDFLDEWHVQVMSVKGHLDLPKRKDPVLHDFGESENGVVAFTDESDIFYEARDLKLHCYIKETTPENLQTRFAGMCDAITEPGLHELVLKNAYNTYMVYQRDGSSIILSGPWNNNQNVAEFDIIFREPYPVYPLLWRGLIGHWMLGVDEEVLGNEIVTGGQDMGDAYWSNYGAPETNEQTDHDGQSNCRHIVDDPGGWGGCAHTQFTSETHRTYKTVYKIKVISGVVSARIRNGDNSQYIWLDNNITDASWTTYTHYWREPAGGATAYIHFLNNHATNSAEFYVDEVSIKEVNTDDLSDENNDGELYGFGDDNPSPSNIYTTDREGTSNECLDFDGVDDYIDPGQTYQSELQEPFSFSLWIKPDDGMPASTEFLVAEWYNTGVLYLYIHSNGKLQVSYKAGSVQANAMTNSAIFSNGVQDWAHVAFTVDENYIKIFVDGVEQQLDATADGDMSDVSMDDFITTRNFYIGAQNNGADNNHFDGKIHDVRFYSRALSYGEVKLLYRLYNNALDY